MKVFLILFQYGDANPPGGMIVPHALERRYIVNPNRLVTVLG